MSYERLPESTQTLYAELLELTIQSAASRAVPDVLAGSFVSKQVKSGTYWYLQRSEAGEKRQIYLGVDSPALRKWIDAVREARGIDAEDAAQRRRLCTMARSGGAHVPNAALARVLELLAEAGVFRLGGVLVGTHAFAAYGNMLGVRFSRQSLSTQDIDVAQDPSIGVALLQDVEPIDVEKELRASGLGFHAVPELDARRPSTSFKIRGKQLRVDFLTPLRGRAHDEPIYLEAFQVAAQPLRMLDFLIEEPVQAVVVGGDGVLVNVPSPARFALHKAWLSQRRDVAWQSKASKDLRQAKALLEVLREDRPGDIELALEALKKYPKARRAVDEALAS